MRVALLLLLALVLGAPAGAIPFTYDVELTCVTGCVGSFAGEFAYDSDSAAGMLVPLTSFRFDVLGVIFDDTDVVDFAGAGVDALGAVETFVINVYDVVTGVSINLLASNSDIWQAGGTSLPDMTGTTGFTQRGGPAIPEPSSALLFGLGGALVAGYGVRKGRADGCSP